MKKNESCSPSKIEAHGKELGTPSIRQIKHKERSVGLDILRVAFALLIYFYHSKSHFHCSYGLLNDFFNTPMIAMTGFFMLSGYSLIVAYGDCNFCDRKKISFFYKKRFVAIYPLYFVVGLLVVVMKIAVGVQTVKDNILLAPIELLGIQSYFDGAFFSFSHNSGTWFVSCIFFCYLVFPIIKEAMSNLSQKGSLLLVLLLVMLLSYFHYIPKHFTCGEIYTNPFVRMFEFVLGMSVAIVNMKFDKGNRLLGMIKSWPALVMALLLLTICWKSPYQYSAMFVFLPIAFLVIGRKNNIKNRRDFKVLQYVSRLTYAFYLGQFFVWDPLKFLQLQIGELSNFTKIVISFVLCWVVSIALYEIIEKRIGGAIRKRIIKDTLV